MFTSLSSKLVLVQFAAIAIILALGYWYFSHSQSTIQQLNQNIAKLETAVKIQEDTIAAQKQAADRQNGAIFELQKSLADAELTKKNLEAKLRKIDLQALARTNAVQLEMTINQSTAQSFKELEQITQPKIGSNTQTNNTTPVSPQTTTTTSSNVQPPPKPPVRSGVAK